jgi:[acyl-carrier-protein] S-malonyltransferase
MTTALIFPGQGSQAIGMGRALAEAFPAAAAVFAEVDDALGEKLSELMWNGSADDLTLTRNTQPALMAVSLAAVRAIEAETGRLAGRVAFLAGHSLGEYSALAAAGSLTVADAARLLRIRGDAMQRAVPVGEGAMAAIIGLAPDDVRLLAEEAAGDEVCQPANDNGAGQVVISGHAAAVGRAVELAKARGAKRAVLLPVSAPFHCRLMAPAAEAMAEALATVAIAEPALPVVANVTARPVADAVEIRNRLVEQVTGMVRWRESVEWLAGAGVAHFAELGPGRVLAGLVRRIVPDADTASAGTPEELPAVIARLG